MTMVKVLTWPVVAFGHGEGAGMVGGSSMAMLKVLAWSVVALQYHRASSDDANSLNMLIELAVTTPAPSAWS